MTPPTEPTGDAWAWPEGAWQWPDDDQARGDLAHLLEQAAQALRDGRAVVRRSATSTTTGGPNRLDVDMTWTP